MRFRRCRQDDPGSRTPRREARRFARFGRFAPFARFLGSLILATLATLVTEDLASARQEPAATDRGRSLFLAQCARCHGAQGAGGEGPRLATPRLQQAASEDEVLAIIVQGIPGSPMEATWQISSDEARLVASYVWSMGRASVVADLPGDPGRGEIIYGRAPCIGCHLIDGVGGTLGPALTDIGSVRGLDHLRESIVDPGTSLPEPPSRYYESLGSPYLPVRVRTHAGEMIYGMRVNEDTFSIQIRGAEDAYYSIRKDDIASLEKLFGTSLMPSYPRLTDQELDDLVSYLATLRGKQ